MISSSQRLAKRIAAAGICSRRDAEKLIAAGRVRVDGQDILTPAFNVTDDQRVEVDGEALPVISVPRLFLYHKPPGLITTHKDEQGRPTVFSTLPKELPRVISIGRLDLNSEGLLLLTTSGELARAMEHPSSGLKRTYRLRVFGDITPDMLKQMQRGVTVEGIRYGAITAKVDSVKGGNSWLTVSLHEGKNRELRKVFEHFGCRVNRLIRTAYGDYALGDLPAGEVREVAVK